MAGYLHLSNSRPSHVGTGMWDGPQPVSWAMSYQATKFSNAMLLDKALRGIRSGDILMAHLGIWSRPDPWAPAVLEPLIVGLKQKGFCFKTLKDHPQLGIEQAF